MIKIFKRLISDSLFKHSALIFGSSVIVNLFNLVFWLFMVRRLEPVDYGVLNSLISVMLIFSVPTSVLMTVVTRYVSKFMAHQKTGEVRALLLYFLKRMLIFVAALLLIFFAYARGIAVFLKIDDNVALVYMIGIGTVFSIATGLFLGVLNGMQKFFDVAIINTVSSIVKLAIGVVFVFLGFKVFGGLSGFVASFLVILCMAFFAMPGWARKLSGGTDNLALNLKDIYRYFLPVGACQFAFMALTNTDVILVKHFFVPLEAGYYSVAQMVGKIVLFFPGAIGLVMFPKVVDSHAKKGKTKGILKKSLMAVGLLCIIANFFVFTFPVLILKLLTGSSHPEAASLVKYFSLSMSFFALNQILMLYHLSLRQLRYIYALVAAAILQVIAIWFLHSSLAEVLFILLAISVLLFILGVFISSREPKDEKS